MECDILTSVASLQTEENEMKFVNRSNSIIQLFSF